MKVTLIHGEDDRASYKRFSELRESIVKKGWVIKTLNLSSNISEQFRSSDLFLEKQVYFLNDISKLKKEDLMEQGFLVIYSNHEVTLTQIKILPKDAKQEKFDVPKVIYNFLDSFYPGNSKKVLNLFHELTKREPAELVFAILTRHIRDLYWVKVDEVGLPYPDWRVLKILKQADKFTIDNLKFTINTLAEIDVKTKTSGEKLVTLLDFSILTNLQ